MQAMSAIKTKQSRCTQLTSWMGFHAGNVSNQNQLCNLLITSCMQYLDLTFLLIQFIPFLPLKLLIKKLFIALIVIPTY